MKQRKELVCKRELQLYLPLSDTTPEDRSQSDVLSNLAQLTTLQLNALRAVICLCDCKSLYVLAVAPSSSHNQHERICDKTTPCGFAMTTFVEDNRDLFVVLDLVQDSRFDPYRSNFPNDRFYVAVPIRTTAGVVIGCIGVYDNSPRDKVDHEQLQLLQDRAGTVMDHLATLRSMREGYHGERMIKALGVFMEGESSSEWSSFSSRGEHSPISDSFKRQDPVGLIHLANSRKKLDIPPFHIPQTELGLPLRGHPRPYRLRSPPHKAREGSLISDETYSVLHRASVLIREALDVDGVAFLDISLFNRDRHGISSNISSNSRSHSRDVAQNQHLTGHVLGCSIDQGNNQDIAIPTPLLRNLVLRYGRGGTFHHEEDSLTPLADENILNIDASSPVDSVSSNDLGDDMRQLCDIFPGSNSVAFFPLWDFRQMRWFAGCFVWTKNPRRVFTESKDITYLAAFNNSVMTEVSRLDLRAADCEKADFISSVSHEWRTPLHGILNMMDILKETNVTPVQRYLIDITTNCGKTLVDTVNHVLDYAKINSLIGRATHDQPPEQPGASPGSHFNTPALINQVNMATLVEEVAETLLASQDYLGRNAEALFSAAEQTVDRPFRESNIPNTIPKAIFAIVDIEWRDSWECCVSAGAWRRILLNLFGNALKFTPSGFVQLKLRHDTLKIGHEDLPAFLIQISDSGRGISPDFCFSNLYTPFQQEDSLSPGIGVGLNIVYRIVDSMCGLIDLHSEPDQGTVVSVILPITPAQRPSLVPLSYADLRKRLRGKTISLFTGSSKYGNLKIDQETFNAMLASMKDMITQWFGVRVLVPSDRVPEYADITIITEHEYRYSGADESAGVYDETPRTRKYPMTSFPIIVLCTHAHSWFQKPRDPREPVVFLQQPISPRTLASALTRCLDQSTQSHDMEDKELAEALSTLSDGTKQHSKELGKVNSVGYSNKEPRYNQDYGALDHRHLKQRCTVLLVEDNGLNLKILENIMEKAGFTHQSAVNGLEAVQRVQCETFHAIIMDLSMPVMDGVTASRKIREYEKSKSLRPVTIIALTAVDTPAMKQDAMNSGINFFLTKPVNKTQLKEILSTLAT